MDCTTNPRGVLPLLTWISVNTFNISFSLCCYITFGSQKHFRTNISISPCTSFHTSHRPFFLSSPNQKFPYFSYVAHSLCYAFPEHIESILWTAEHFPTTLDKKGVKYTQHVAEGLTAQRVTQRSDLPPSAISGIADITE